MNFPLFARSFIRNYMFRRGRIGRSKFKKILRFFLPQHQKVNLDPGLSMVLDFSRKNQEFIFWFYEELEPSLQWAIKTLLPMGGVFVDCGANAGLMGLLAIHGRAAKAVFIEPHPRLAETIRKNIELNQFTSNAIVWECAASSEENTASLYLNSMNDGGHTLRHPHQSETGSTVLVKTRRLEDLFSKGTLQHIDFLKVDTEGHDFHVLTGLGSYLCVAHVDLIFVEMDGDYGKIWEMLSKRGYRPFASHKIYIDQLRRLERKKDFSCFYSPIEKPGDGNLLWCARGSCYEKVLLTACAK